MSTIIPFHEWYTESFEREIMNKNISSKNLVILHLKSHIDKNLWKPLIAGWSIDDVASNLKLWLDTLNATYNSSPDEQKYRQNADGDTGTESSIEPLSTIIIPTKLPRV
jgi:hypothetical protein